MTMTSQSVNGKFLTRFEPFETKISWTLENFSLCNKRNKEKIESQIFPKLDEDLCEWRLWLYPYGYSDESKDYVSVYLEFKSTQKDDSITAQYDIVFQDTENKIIKYKKHLPDKFKNNGIAYGYDKFMKRNDLVPLLKNDVLVINCCVKWQRNINEAITSCNEKETISKLDLQDNLSSDFHQLLENSILSDVSLLAMDGAKFPAHKCVLAARSTVFAAMFEHMKERRKSVVEINDVKAHILKTLLEFIYSGKFVKDECDIEEVLAIADKYNVEKLKSLCEQELCQKLTVENAVNFLLLADRHKANMLKGKVLELITNNLRDALKTQAMKNLSITQTSVFYELLEAVADKIQG